MLLEMSYQRCKGLFRAIEWTETQRNKLTGGPNFWVSWMAGNFYILVLLRICRVEGDMYVTSKLWSMTVMVFSLNQLQSSFGEHCLDCLPIRADSSYWTILRCLVKKRIRGINTCWVSMLYHGFFFSSPLKNDLISLWHSRSLVDFQIGGDSLMDELTHFMTELPPIYRWLPSPAIWASASNSVSPTTGVSTLSTSDLYSWSHLADRSSLGSFWAQPMVPSLFPPIRPRACLFKWALGIWTQVQSTATPLVPTLALFS